MEEEWTYLLTGTDVKHSVEDRKATGQYYSYKNVGEEIEKKIIKIQFYLETCIKILKNCQANNK